MSRIARQRFQSHGQDSLHFSILDLARRTRTRLIQQPVQTLLHKAGPPLSDHLLSDLKPGCHFGVGLALGTSQE